LYIDFVILCVLSRINQGGGLYNKVSVGNALTKKLVNKNTTVHC